jgi:hypothetical protein
MILARTGFNIRSQCHRIKCLFPFIVDVKGVILVYGVHATVELCAAAQIIVRTNTFEIEAILAGTWEG